MRGTRSIVLTLLQTRTSSKSPSLTFHCQTHARMSGEPPSKKQKTGETLSKGAADEFLTNVCERRKKAAENISKFKFLKSRVRVLSKDPDFPDDFKGIVYWMSREQRVQDNWALLYAQKLALKFKVSLHVVFCLVPKFLEATIRQYGFMLKGLQEVEQECRSLDIPFHLLTGYAKDTLPDFISSHDIGGVVCDFSPLRVPSQWVQDVVKGLPSDVPLCQVDAHNIVPCWEASPKLEYGARTIRRKINDQLPQYLTEFPPVIQHPHKPTELPEPVDWPGVEASLTIDRGVQEVTWATPGTSGGLRNLHTFIDRRLKLFGTSRNNPNVHALSDMSPWYHFGQVSVQRAILLIKDHKSRHREAVEGYMEEAIVRRELADNFCFYNPKYDSVDGAYDWAKKTLADHSKDKREYVYTREQLDQAQTHDDLWNAAQIQMTKEGKMHGFLRMYWAKKILEWTESPEQALEIAIYLNDRYQLDGRDPNGYVGCMWSVCGIHDQGWAERAVFGKIRFMNYQGCKRKFDVAAFVKKYNAKVHGQKNDLTKHFKKAKK